MSIPSFPFDYLRLPDAAKALGWDERSLLHAAGAGAVQLCVNVYGQHRKMRLSRLDADDGHSESDPQAVDLTEDERAERDAHDAEYAGWLARCTTPMPAGIYELDAETARYFEMPETASIDLYEAFKFNEDGWWCVEFFNGETDEHEPIRVWRENLVILREELIRLLKPATAASEPAQAKPLGTRERDTLLCIIGALARQAGLDLSQPMKAGDTVAAMAPELSMTGRTIGEHLKRVGPAMDGRTK